MKTKGNNTVKFMTEVRKKIDEELNETKEYWIGRFSQMFGIGYELFRADIDLDTYELCIEFENLGVKNEVTFEILDYNEENDTFHYEVRIYSEAGKKRKTHFLTIFCRYTTRNKYHNKSKALT